MLRFFERVINNFRFLDVVEIQSKLNELRRLIADCDSVEMLIGNYSRIKNFIIEMREILNNTSKENTVNVEKCYYNFIGDLENLVESISCSAFENSHKFTVDLDDRDLMLLKTVIEHFESSDINIEFSKSLDIGFNNVSDGLNYYLKLFSTITTCMNRNESEKYKDVILLLDEPETRFHPDLARCFIDDLIKFLRDNFSDLNFQIIITTHSPFILSDIVKENIIRVSKRSDGFAEFHEISTKTFGADIHYLLKDAFFLPITTGEFSRGIIQEIINKIKPNTDGISPTLDKSEIAKYHAMISVIGEPIIRNKLLQMLRNCTKCDSTKLEFLNNEMMRIKKEIESIEG